MEIRLPTTGLIPTQTGTKGISNLLAQLRPGENLTAVVETQLAEDNFLLKLTDSGQTMRAHSQLELSAGQVLRLEVVKLGATPELRIVPTENADAPETVAIQQALRQFLPKQQDLGTLPPILREVLSQQSGQDAQNLPETLRMLVKAVLDALPQKGSLVTADGLRQATRNSGLFLEAQLATQPAAMRELVARDLKSGLLVLNEALKILVQGADGKAMTSVAGDAPRPDAEILGASVQAPGNQPAAAKSAANPLVASPEPSGGEVLKGPPTAETKALSGQLTNAANADAEAYATPPSGSKNTPGPGPVSPTGSAPVSPMEETPESSGTQTIPGETAEPSVSEPPDGKLATDQTGTGKPPTSEQTSGGQAKPGDATTGKTPFEQVGSGGEKAALKAGVDTSSSSAESKSPTLLQVASKLLTPEPPKLVPASPTLPADIDLPESTPNSMREAISTALNRAETAPGTDQPTLKDVAARQTATPLPLSDVPEEMANLKSLQHHTEGALARIVLDQLASLPQGEGKPLVWQMEIPFTDDGRSDSAKLKIVREQSSAAQSGQAYWSVILELSPPGLGTIHSRITLCGERVDTYFWTDRGSTSSLIKGNLDLLAARMHQAGLQVGELNALPGAPSDANPANAPVASLVDERA